MTNEPSVPSTKNGSIYKIPPEVLYMVLEFSNDPSGCPRMQAAQNNTYTQVSILWNKVARPILYAYLFIHLSDIKWKCRWCSSPRSTVYHQPFYEKLLRCIRLQQNVIQFVRRIGVDIDECCAKNGKLTIDQENNIVVYALLRDSIRLKSSNLLISHKNAPS